MVKLHTCNLYTWQQQIIIDEKNYVKPLIYSKIGQSFEFAMVFWAKIRFVGIPIFEILSIFGITPLKKFMCLKNVTTNVRVLIQPKLLSFACMVNEKIVIIDHIIDMKATRVLSWRWTTNNSRQRSLCWPWIREPNDYCRLISTPKWIHSKCLCRKSRNFGGKTQISIRTTWSFFKFFNRISHVWASAQISRVLIGNQWLHFHFTPRHFYFAFSISCSMPTLFSNIRWIFS